LPKSDSAVGERIGYAVTRGHAAIRAVSMAWAEHIRHEQAAEEREAPWMPVAIETFSCDYLGDRITVQTGEWCIDGHELAARFPGSFRLDPLVDKRPLGKKPRARSTPPRLGSAARGTWGGPTERYRVEFTKYARMDLDAALGEFDGLEVGGGLFRQVRGNTFLVEAVGRQAPGVYRTTFRTELSASGCEELARNSGLTWCGDWHVHDRGDGNPSDVDQRRWESCRAGGRAWLGLIITPGDPDNWLRLPPRYHAWTVADNGLRAASLIT
jgi:proteasome lid subunit RPN8/RPN11